MEPSYGSGARSLHATRPGGSPRPRTRVGSLRQVARRRAGRGDPVHRDASRHRLVQPPQPSKRIAEVRGETDHTEHSVRDRGDRGNDRHAGQGTRDCGRRWTRALLGVRWGAPGAPKYDEAECYERQPDDVVQVDAVATARKVKDDDVPAIRVKANYGRASEDCNHCQGSAQHARRGYAATYCTPSPKSRCRTRRSALRNLSRSSMRLTADPSGAGCRRRLPTGGPTNLRIRGAGSSTTPRAAIEYPPPRAAKRAWA